MIVPSEDRAACSVIIFRWLELGWDVGIKSHADRAGPSGAPVDPDHPEVYSVCISNTPDVQNFTITRRVGRGRSGHLLTALAQASEAAEQKPPLKKDRRYR